MDESACATQLSGHNHCSDHAGVFSAIALEGSLRQEGIVEGLSLAQVVPLCSCMRVPAVFLGEDQNAEVFMVLCWKQHIQLLMMMCH